MIIRNERADEYRAVEELTKRAFWNVNVPGCDEHYLVHILRTHPDFIPELDLVLEENGRLIAHVMYTKSKLVDEKGAEKEILTFGPVSVLPEFQRRGYGKRLLEESFERASKLGYDTIVIYGNPANYVARGFKSCRKFNVCIENDAFPSPLLVKELKEGALDGRKWAFEESHAYWVNEKDAEEFDRDFPQMEKGWSPTQEDFYIASHSRTIW